MPYFRFLLWKTAKESSITAVLHAWKSHVFQNCCRFAPNTIQITLMNDGIFLRILSFCSLISRLFSSLLNSVSAILIKGNKCLVFDLITLVQASPVFEFDMPIRDCVMSDEFIVIASHLLLAVIDVATLIGPSFLSICCF